MSKIPGRSRGFSFSALVGGVVWGNRNTSVSFCKYTGRLEVEVRVRMSMRKILRVQCEYRDCRGESKCLAATANRRGRQQQPSQGGGDLRWSVGPGEARQRERELGNVKPFFKKN
jgi:hypothetical protein